jgi:putative addiction module component (TIGR02574 family)
MTQRTAELLAEVLLLPEQERSEFAARLMESLDAGADEDAEAAWDAEIQQRLGEIQSGQVQPLSWPDARRLILEDGDDSGED